MFSPARHLFNSYETFHAFRNTRFQNTLHGFDKKTTLKNEEPIKVLFLGCDDIQNVLNTSSKTAPEAQLEIHLNDHQPAVIARNILMLHIASKPCFSLNNTEDAEYLWDVWYNSFWPETTAERFLCDIKDLIEKKLSPNIKITNSQDWMKVCSVLHEWEKILREITVNEAVQMRMKFMMDPVAPQAQSVAFGDKAGRADLDAFVSTVAANIDTKLGLEELSKGIRESVHQEVANYYSTGVCWRPSKDGNVCVNPTFLDAIIHKWKINPKDCPFDGYLPLEKDELNLAQQKGIMRQTCLEILKKSVAKYRERMAKTEIYLNIGDALEFCLSDSPVKFDVIDSSNNLADFFGLTNVLISCSHRLGDQVGSRVFTGSVHWPSVASTCYCYVEDGLCCPISMAPTFYGLRLMNQPELGIPYPFYAESETYHYVRLCFEKTAPFENISLGLSEVLQDFIRKLAKKCFTCIFRSDANLVNQCYSPLTFAYILTDLRRRLEAGGGELKVMPSPDVPEKIFSLSRRAITDWSLGKLVKLYTLKSEPFQPFAAMVQHFPFQLRYLRVALLPSANLIGSEWTFPELRGPRVHYIDNVRCDITRDSMGGIKTMEFSFILPEEHQLPCGYAGAMVDVHGQPIVKFDSLDVFKVETLKTPYPFRVENVAQTSHRNLLMVEYCTETVDSYTLHVKGQPDFTLPINKLKVTSNRKSPCRSAHTLNVSFGGIEEMEPLRLTFPIPILVDKVDISLNERIIGLYLPKATLELWPSDYEDKTPKMDPDALPPWKSVPGNKQTLLKTHLKAQYTQNAPKSDFQRPLVASLRKVRTSMEVFLSGSSNQFEIFILRLNDTSGKEKDLFLTKAHLPIRKSPSGGPMVFLTVLDLKESKRLVKRGKLTESQLEDMKKLFRSSRERCVIGVDTKHERNLWNYIFKLNSLKIMPSEWQSSKLTTNGPLIATFVSPLYTEVLSNRTCSSGPLPSAYIPSFQEFFERFANRRSCENCGEQDGELKRCAKCKKVLYCSTDCQKKDWESHKTVCVARV